MKHLFLAFKLLIFGYLIYLLYFLSAEYHPVSASFRPPLIIWVVDIFNLYIHEAGHFFFSLFNRWLYFLGGSLLQTVIPLALLIVTFRRNPEYAVYPGFWLGENLVNVSVYIMDAPYRQLRLLGAGSIHDWHWLLSGNLGAAEPLGETVFFTGIVICAASVVTGIVFAFRDYRWHMETP